MEFELTFRKVHLQELQALCEACNYFENTEIAISPFAKDLIIKFCYERIYVLMSLLGITFEAELEQENV